MTKVDAQFGYNSRIKDFVSQSLGVGGKKGESLEQMRHLLRERCKKDLQFLCYHALEFYDTDSELHHDMAQRWQRRRDVLFSLWQVPRGHLKTSEWTEGGTIQELLINPHQRALICNAKLDNAVDMLANIRSYFETLEVLRWLFPDYCWDLAPRDVARRCKVLTERLDFPTSKYAGRREGNIRVLGVEASLVSQHYDLMIFDDPVNDKNSATRLYRDKIEGWYQDALQLRHDPARSRIRLIGTDWHHDDLYTRIRKREEKWRKQLKEQGQKVVPNYWLYIRQVYENVPEGVEGQEICGVPNVAPIWPERFTKETIEKIRSDIGSYKFSCQYMNNPVASEDAIFRLEDINIVDLFELPEGLEHFMAVDLAVSDKEESDYTAITVAGFDDEGKMYVREVVRQKMMPKAAIDVIAHLSERWNVNRVAIETQAFQLTVLSHYKEVCAREGWNVPWMEVKRGASAKLKRILALQPRVERGDFYVEDGIRNMDELIDEMTSVTVDHLPAYDDILDTLADLEQAYYKAPRTEPEKPAPDTYAAVYGELIEEEFVGSYSPRGQSSLEGLL